MLKDPPIFCAIDTPDLDAAVALAERIGPVTRGIKLGLEFFNSFGPDGVDKVMSASPDAALFLDLKFHDIPNTVAGAVRSICRRFEPMYLNVHAAGGLEMMRASKDAVKDTGSKTSLLAVTVLTSLDDFALEQVGYAEGAQNSVLRMAELTLEAGLSGVVCSSHEIETIRSVCGESFVLMVPGIRPSGSDKGDQKRVMTPLQATAAGATHLVVGRPITQALDPIRVAGDILGSLSN